LVVYVQKCRDRIVPTPKRPDQMSRTETARPKRLRPIRSDRYGQTESARPKSRVPLSTMAKVIRYWRRIINDGVIRQDSQSWHICHVDVVV